ncbi:MAG: hypothetical protein J7M01_03570 [Candidatus Marinimicrobia bacterium]|nr:hypothetical protein [Candidatus Neomarinimicrobiota bacterium]
MNKHIIYAMMGKVKIGSKRYDAIGSCVAIIAIESLSGFSPKASGQMLARDRQAVR